MRSGGVLWYHGVMVKRWCSILLLACLCVFVRYRTLPTVALVGDAFWLDTSWSQGSHALRLPLALRGWRLSVVRWEQVPETRDAMLHAVEETGASVVVLSPVPARTAASLGIVPADFPGTKLAAIGAGDLPFPIVFRERYEDGFALLAASEDPPLLVSDVPVPADLAALFPNRERLDGDSPLYAEHCMDRWRADGVDRIAVYRLAHLSDYDAMPKVVPAPYCLSAENLDGIIAVDYAPLVNAVDPACPAQVPLPGSLRASPRMRGGLRARALAAFRRRFL